MFSDDFVTIYHGDCLDVMRGMEADSIDAIVTDPPYGLSFMGREWDHGVPGEAFWAEALRVAKPGAHLVAFGGTRTYHRLAVAIEDAGWEIRDCLGWLYGSGFPKSLDVSKAIDKEAGAERPIIGTHPSPAKSIYSQATATLPAEVPVTKAATAAAAWSGWGTALKPAWEPIILARKPLTSTVAGNVQRWGTGALNIDATRVPTSQDDARSSRAGSTCDTCPLREVSPPSRSEDTHTRGASVAGHADRSVRLANASVGGSSGQSRTGSRGDCRPSAHSDDGPPRLGEGADRASALPQDGADEPHGHLPDKRCIHAGLSTCPQYTTPNVEQQGRWPANIVHDGSDEVLAVFPQSSSSSSYRPPDAGGTGNCYTVPHPEGGFRGHDDAGSNARFFAQFPYTDDDRRVFYTAKASKSERDEGLFEFPEQFQANAEFRPNHMEKALAGDSGKPHGRYTPRKNFHPTVKPLDLMRWLVRLVTPPEGIVLDPFMGSGTTLKAARAEGHRSIGIDLEREHCEIAWGRLSQGVLL